MPFGLSVQNSRILDLQVKHNQLDCHVGNRNEQVLIETFVYFHEAYAVTPPAKMFAGLRKTARITLRRITEPFSIIAGVVHSVKTVAGDNVVVHEAGYLEEVEHLVLVLSLYVLFDLTGNEHFLPKEIVQSEKHDCANIHVQIHHCITLVQPHGSILESICQLLHYFITLF